MSLTLTGAGPTNTASGGGGAPPPFAPTDLSGLTLWLDPSDEATLWETSDESTPIDFEALPANVGRWADKSGAGRVMTQATLGRRPLSLLGPGAPGDKPVVQVGAASGASSDQFDSTIALTDLFGTAAMTAFTVIRSTAAGGLLGDSTGTNFRVWWPGNTSISATVYNGTGGESTVTKTTLALNTIYILCIRRDATMVNISADGGAETNVATTGNLNLGAATFAAPDRNAATKALGWHGDIAIFNRSLTAAERNQMGAYLADKWGGTWVDQS